MVCISLRLKLPQTRRPESYQDLRMWAYGSGGFGKLEYHAHVLEYC